jgi:hypothetical protein
MDEDEKRVLGVLPPISESDRRLLGPLFIVIGAFAMVLLLFGVNVISFFGHRCFYVGNAAPGNCIPEPMYFGGWLVSIVTCVGGILMMAQRRASSGTKGIIRDGNVSLPTEQNSTSSLPYEVASFSSPQFDRLKWAALLKYDPQLAAIAEKLLPLGQKWVDEFAASYLAINDKGYLPSIVSKIISDAKKEDEERH